MQFIDSNLEIILPYLDKLTPDTKPLWGTMSAQQMVEHLIHTVEIAVELHQYPVQVNEEMYEKLQAFILSDKPLPRNFNASFVKENPPLIHEEIELATDAYCEAWIDLELWFAANPGRKTVHPHFGPLDFSLWKRLHEKHLTHHFIQFGLIKE